MKSELIKIHHPFTLESGIILPELEIAFSIQGNPKTQPIVWVCHALTGNQFVNEWWSGIFGPDQFFNPDEYCIICANVLGSAYGTTGPLNVSDTFSFADFPEITTKDMVNVHELLANYLGIDFIDVLIGASIGGQQAIEWASRNSVKIDQLILIATNAVHSPYGRAFNEAQRLAIKADLTFGLKAETAGQEGLKAARAIAMLSYRTYQDFSLKQNEESSEKTKDYRAATYLNYQGEKLMKRFNAYSYYRLTQAMDSHHIARGSGLTIEEKLRQITARTLVLGINSDLLFPPAEQRFIAINIPEADYVELNSPYGHDAFLIEYDWLKIRLKAFLEQKLKRQTIRIHTSLKRKVS